MIAFARFITDCLSAFDRLIPTEVRARPADLRAARLLMMLAASAAISVPLLTAMYYLLGFDAAGRVVLTGGLVMLVSPFAMNAGVGVAAARELFICALFVLKIWLAVHLGGLGAPTVQWFVLCPMIAMLLGGARPGLLWSAVVALTVLAIFYLERVGGKFVAHPVADLQILNLVSVLGLLAFTTIIVLLFWARSVEISEKAAGRALARRARDAQDRGSAKIN
jgi:hypothetical protein